MPIMIWLAVIVEIAIFNWIDMAILLAIQFINATIGWYETVKAGDAVAALKASLKPQATVKRDGVWANIDAALVVPGDMVLLASGSAVPADCVVNEGQIDCDQSALTGESLPVTLKKGYPAQMGSTVVRGEVNGTVRHTGKDTFFGRTAMLLQQTESLGNLQKILMRIVISLSVLSLTLCAIVLAYLLIRKEHFKTVLSFVVVLLVASIPIAIEIVSTTTLALGSRQLSGHGAIVAKLTAIEEMAGMNMLCSDKTGTLTLNKMVIQEDCPTWMPGFGQKETLQHAAMAAKWWEPPRDALDTMTLGAADLEGLKPYKVRRGRTRREGGRGERGEGRAGAGRARRLPPPLFFLSLHTPHSHPPTPLSPPPSPHPPFFFCSTWTSCRSTPWSSGRRRRSRGRRASSR
jgi:H+-transporting ATPase